MCSGVVSPTKLSACHQMAFLHCLTCGATALCNVVQSLVDISSDAGWLDTALAAMTLVQSLMQVRCTCAPAVDACPAWNALRAWEWHGCRQH